MKQFNVFTAFPFSFFSIALYRDIGTRWKAVGFAYLSILAFISVTVSLSLIAYSIDDFLDEWAEETEWGGVQEEIDAFLMQTPDFVIQDDKIQLMPGYEEPYTMYIDTDDWFDEEEYESVEDSSLIPLILFDSTMTVKEFRQQDIPILVASDRILINEKDEGRIETVYIEEFMRDTQAEQPIPVNSEIAIQAAHMAMDWLLENKGMIYGVLFTFYAICGIIFAFLLMILYGIGMGAIGVILGFIIRSPMTFGVAFRIGCVAMTPMVMFNIAMFYFEGQGFSFLEQLGLMSLYMLLGVYSCKGQELQRD